MQMPTHSTIFKSPE